MTTRRRALAAAAALLAWPAARAADAPGPLLAALLQQHGAGTPAFWQALAAQGTPLAEPLDGGSRFRVSFVWRGHESTREVRLFWPVRAGDDPRLQRLGDSDVWWAEVVLARGTRLAYQLAPDTPRRPGATPLQQRRAVLEVVQADPLNPRAFPADPALGLRERSSVLALPGALDEPWAAGPLPARRGTLESIDWRSQRLGNQRRVSVYTPAGAAPAGGWPLLLLFDGPDWLAKVDLPAVLDRAFAAGMLAPMLAVLVGNASPEARGTELPCNPEFADAIALELMPALAQRHAISADPARSTIGGASYGGLAASWIALRHPQRFGRVLSLSGSYWWAPNHLMGMAPPLHQSPEDQWLTRHVAESERVPVRLYLAAGRLERTRPGDGVGILDANRNLRNVLRAKGYRVQHHEFDGGHDWLAWRGELVLGLQALAADQDRS
ncbi:MAG: enterochelin esterase [Rubrivivax sp.]